MAYFRWQEHKTSHLTEAWTAFLECDLPGSYEDVAAQYADVPGLPQQAKRLGADVLLAAVQSDSPLGNDPSSAAGPAPLTDEQRQGYLNRARGLFQEVVEGDDDTLSMTLHVVSALQGMAVVAESLGDPDEARRWYEAAAARAEPFYPWLAEQARERATTVEDFTVSVALPAEADLPQKPSPEPVQPVVIDPALRDLLLPDDSGQG
jgi:hypothetical protein